MNYIQSVVKILESPKYKKINKDNHIIEFRAQLPTIKGGSQIIKLVFKNKLAYDVINYYEKNDYIMVEGYLSIRIKTLLNSSKQNLKKAEIIVLKVYPFLLTSNFFVKKT